MECLRHAPTVFLASGGTGDINKFTFDYNVGVKATSTLQSSGKTGITNLAGLKSSTAMRINALPYVLYNKIVKEYQNSNLLQNNPHWYPENENHDQILPYSATGAVTTSDYDNPTQVFVNGTSRELISAVNDGTDDNPVYNSYPWLNVLQYSQRKGDYFNTGSPFPDLIRGDIPTLSITGASVASGTLDFTDSVISQIVDNGNTFIIGIDRQLKKLGLLATQNQVSGAKISAYSGNDSGHIMQPAYEGATDDVDFYLAPDYAGEKNLIDALNKGKLTNAVVNGIQMSMSQWRYLATMTVLRERLALTDGSYNELIKAMFGHNPRLHNHNAIYCGGTRQPIVFNEVVNTAESATAPLGDIAGRAVSSQNNDLIHVHSDDYGCFMSVLVITPDEYYSQGVDKMWSRLENAQQYLPILNNLAPDSTLNKELYVSGTNLTDEDVFNHQERFAYYKSRRNEVSGLLSLAISKIGDAGAWVMQRLFSNTPQFNAEFNRGTLTDNEKAVFASTNQAQFNVVIGSNMRFIAPIPEDSRPSDMGISY